MSLIDLSERRSPAPPPPSLEGPSRTVEDLIDRARSRLLDLQHEDGHWCAELEGDSILESEYVLTLYSLGRAGEAKAAKAGESLRRQRQPGGGWGPFPGSGPDVNATVKAYFVLKLLGDSPDAPHMREARATIQALGGLSACNSFTRIYLAVFGQYPWARCPAVPPELVLLPDWAPVSIYRMSSWSRAILVPLSIVSALKPRCEVPEHLGLSELESSPGRPPSGPSSSLRARAWRGIFRLTEWALRLYEKAPVSGLRRRAIERARLWTLDHLEMSDGLGAIFPPIVNSIFALRAAGLEADDPRLEAQVRELERLELEESETLRVQPCFSAVWDTALALDALLDSGLPGDSAPARRAADWLLEREVRTPGDWARKCPQGAVGGWYFEYANEFYPDCDDTAQVVTVLSKLELDLERQPGLEAAVQRGVAWLGQMQNRNGGWGAFDLDCDREFLTYIPFADHNAMIDPATVDVTARVIEALLRSGVDARSSALTRAVDFLRGEQESDGAWYGRWGCNYVYGTWLAMTALRRAGLPAGSALDRGAAWLRSCQNADGGWGELPETYVDPATRGQGPSTACQTAWALLGLMAAGDVYSEALDRGVDYLAARQAADGGWTDTHWTGTGFPGVFYLRYHLYATYFPLSALSTLRRLRAGEDVYTITRPGDATQ